jgi:hypothetical protein
MKFGSTYERKDTVIKCSIVGQMMGGKHQEFLGRRRMDIVLDDKVDRFALISAPVLGSIRLWLSVWTKCTLLLTI